LKKAILGISAYYHDSAAALLLNGKIIAAAHEERFTRKKHDSSFPRNAIQFVLDYADISYNELSVVAFYDKPYIKFERLLETYHAFAPKGLTSFLSAMPVWIKEKLFIRKMLKKELLRFGKTSIPLVFPEHHLSHAASAFYPSPFKEAAILTVDGVGEWATAMIGHGDMNQIKIIKELRFPHSLGLLYSAFTYYTGFKVNSGEYKLMGLAPYGNQDSDQVNKFREIILSELVDIKEDGSILLNMKYFNYATGLRMTNNKLWERLFGFSPREKESEISQEYMNMALAIQRVTEEIVLRLSKTVKELTKSDYLVLAGGVALNSVANGKIFRSGMFKDIWIQPAAGDAGGSIGAAYAVWYISKNNQREIINKKDSMMGSYLGPSYDFNSIMKIVRKYNAPYRLYNDYNELVKQVVLLLSEGKVVGWFQGRMEYGPRALGNRSILGDARNPEMQKKMNLKIKYREGFRPFAPSVLEEDISNYFMLDRPSPYMLLVVPVNGNRRNILPDNYWDLEMFERLYYPRSDVPAITHIDFSARVQSVNKTTNFRFWTLLHEFKNQTECSVLINTSFNVRGEPIVCSPDDAYKCFMRTEMDFLVIEDFLFDKEKQSMLIEDKDWRDKFQLD
jgi:carbamoyltransferase